MVVDETKLQEFIGKVVNEWGAAEGALITYVGDRLGLFKAMAGAGELTSEELAKKTGTHPRIIKEWLASQAAGGFITYNRVNGTYTLPEEQAFALTDVNSPAYIAGFYQSIVKPFQR
jgi:transcription initiation factor IIE alpha subunit